MCVFSGFWSVCIDFAEPERLADVNRYSYDSDGCSGCAERSFTPLR